jgi:hypothetical protein
MMMLAMEFWRDCQGANSLLVEPFRMQEQCHVIQMDASMLLSHQQP